MTSPTRPGVSVDAQQQVLIESLPPILVLHLKRFLYDTQVGDVVKIGKPISFTPELEIDSSMLQRLDVYISCLLTSAFPGLISPVRRQSQKARYKLFGGKEQRLSDGVTNWLTTFRQSFTIMVCPPLVDITPSTSFIRTGT